MKTITLSDENYKQLINELHSLFSYHWNDDRIHADDCGSKVLPYIENQEYTECEGCGAGFDEGCQCPKHFEE
jgi:hypothetical protein